MYEQRIYQFLSVYRFFSFAVAVVLTEVMPLRTGEAPPLQTYLVLTLLGVYTLLKVFSPVRWQQRGLATYVILMADLILCILLVLFTGGLNSGFLLYSLIPIITAALLFEERTALFATALSSIALVVAHTVFSQFSNRFVWVLEDNYLPLLIVYIISCFLIATVTYRTNLNIIQRIQWEAILNERRRIRQELHDGIAQALGYLTLKANLVKDSVSAHNADKALAGLADISKIVQGTYEDIRESIDQLSIDIRSLSLIPALSNYVKEFVDKSGIQVDFDAPQGLPRVSAPAELQLLRITQEALTNVRKHSQATQVWVKLESDRGGLKMTVKDNGRGLPPGWEEYEEKPMAYRGLTIMRERAESLGGNLTILSTPGKGTEISVSLPVQKVRL